jgi:hypothetical protein
MNMKFTRKLFSVVLVVLLALFVFAAAVAASPGAVQELPPSPAPVPNLGAFLQWLIGGGGSMLAVSWILERMTWFQALTPSQKDYTIFGLAAVVGCSALAIVTYVPAGVIDAIAPYFLILASVFVSVFVAKTFHWADK